MLYCFYIQFVWGCKEIKLNIELMYGLCVIVILIAGFFIFNSHRLQQSLREEEQKNQLLTEDKNKLEQWAIQQNTKLESSLERIKERDSTILNLQSQNQSFSAQLTQAKLELAQIKTTLLEKQANFEEQQRNFIEVKQQLNTEFQNLAQKVLEEKSKSFSESNQQSLNLLLKPFKEQIEQFQKRVNEVHSESVKGNANLETEIKRILDIGLSMSQDAQNLTTALKGNNKVAGNWGEVQLESALQSAGLLKDEHYLSQESYQNEEGKRFAPDFVIKLPDNKHLVLDSKVSLVAYDKAVRSDDNLAISQALSDHCKSVRTHIDGLSKKNYSQLLGIKSPDFVLMFVPIEPAYIEAMKYDPQLFNYGYERNVILVSYTTLMPILRTVSNLWRIERGNTQAREISEKAGDIYNQVCLVAERLNSLGKTLTTVNKHYNSTVTAVVGQQGLVGKVDRFQALSTKAQQKSPVQLEPLTNDFDTTRLELLVENQE